MINKVLIVPNPFLKEKEQVLNSVISNLDGLDHQIFDVALNNEEAYGELSMALKDSDAVITLGGDGSLLRVAELAARREIPLLGINYGGVGYLTSLRKDQLAFLKRLKENAYEIEKRMMLEVSILHQGMVILRKHALNDVIFGKRKINVSIRVEAKIAEKTLSYLGDGVIVSTPTGSSAYNYSAGGPLVKGTENKLIITPIAPVGRKSSSLICNDSDTIVLNSIRIDRDEAAVSIDGHEPLAVDKNYSVLIRRSNYYTRTICFKK